MSDKKESPKPAESKQAPPPPPDTTWVKTKSVQGGSNPRRRFRDER